MSEKSPAEVGFNTVVIRSWMVEGSGDNGATPRWLSSYSIHGAPPVAMKGEGLHSQNAVVLNAMEAARRIIHAEEWRLDFEWTFYDAAPGKFETAWVIQRAAKLLVTDSDRDPIEVAKEEMAKHAQYQSE